MSATLKSYLVHAAYDYCIHHGYDPYVIVITGGISVLPAESEDDNPTVTFNLSNNAIRNFKLEDEYMSFSARFNGKIFNVSVAVDDIAWLGSPANQIGVPFFETPVSDISKKPPAKQLGATTLPRSSVGNTKLRLL